MDGKPNNVGPASTEALGIADLIAGQVIDHKPGHDQSPPPATETQGQAQPPSQPNAAPGTSLAARLRQGLKGKEESK